MGFVSKIPVVDNGSEDSGETHNRIESPAKKPVFALEKREEKKCTKKNRVTQQVDKDCETLWVGVGGVGGEERDG